MTKMTYGKALDYVLTNCEMPEDVSERIQALAASLAKKNSAERKPTATQKENEHLRTVVADFVKANPAERFLVSDLIAKVPELAGMTPQKVGPLIRALEAEQVVVKVIDKRRTYWKAA